MKKHVKRVVSHPLITGSTVMVIGSLSANAFNYLYNLAMGRMLSVSDYGTLASLVSIFNIFSVFSITIITVYTKFAASFIGQGKENQIWLLLKKGTIWIGIVSLVISLSVAAFARPIGNFLHIFSLSLIYLISVALFFNFVGSVPQGILQGMLKFMSFSFLNIVSSISKLVLAIVLVYMGFRVGGAVNAVVLATIVGYILAFPPLLSFIKKAKGQNLVIPKLSKQLSLYGLPVLLSNLGLTAFISIDIILVKHFFSESTSGQYAALSLMGRSIFYVVAPVTSVFFPLIAQKKERGENLLGTLLLSIFLIGGATFSLSAFYFLFPNIILKIFFPAKEYAVLTNYLGPFSLFIFFFSLCWLLNSFYLAVGSSRILLFTIIASIIEAAYIVMFHSSLSQIIYGLIGISILLLITFLLYYPLWRTQKHT